MWNIDPSFKTDSYANQNADTQKYSQSRREVQSFHQQSLAQNPGSVKASSNKQTQKIYVQQKYFRAESHSTDPGGKELANADTQAVYQGANNNPS